jgi:hypothetical protein
MSVYEKTFTLKDEDHTMGNSVRYMLNKNPQVRGVRPARGHPTHGAASLRAWGVLHRFSTPASHIPAYASACEQLVLHSYRLQRYRSGGETNWLESYRG